MFVAFNISIHVNAREVEVRVVYFHQIFKVFKNFRLLRVVSSTPNFSSPPFVFDVPEQLRVTIAISRLWPFQTGFWKCKNSALKLNK